MIQIDNMTGKCKVEGSYWTILFELMDCIEEMKRRLPEENAEKLKNDILESVEYALCTQEEKIEILRRRTI